MFGILCPHGVKSVRDIAFCAELLREIFVYGDLSKHEAKKLFLEAQQKNEQYVRLYSEKENPTEDNLRAIKGSTEVNQYFERVQQLLNGRLSKN